ncbi:pilus assembly protein [Microbulbifer sp.]|uniref:pilus assembly protein n=1 Tax=Microbulbifer sp. TaxID=1908541 RepID=UPI002F939C08
MRYLAGKAKSATFDSDDSSYISGLSSPTWTSPISSNNYCAALNVIQFNASSSSYDNDFSGASDLNAIGSVDTWTNKVGAAEGIHGKNFFVGDNGSNTNQLCTPKTVANLSDVAGTCPDAPRLGGTYDIAGLAYYARTSKIRTDFNVGNVTTYGVALAPAVPKVTIPVSTDSKVTLLPACRNKDVGGNCAIVDFKVVTQSADGTSGKLYVNWEDSEQGGDFDQDMWGVINYSVSGSELTVTTDVIAESTVDDMGFGYVIAGTTNDGFHVHSGIEGFTDGDCDNCQVGDGATSKKFVVGSSSANTLEQPLYYAAKWGGFSDDENGNLPTEAEIAAAAPKTYFYAIDPAELEESLGKALEQVAASAGSASSVATNSTRLGTETVIYQALFNSTDWSGEIKALNLKSDGTVGTVKWQSDNSKFNSVATRKVYSHNGTTGVEFKWGATALDGGISDAQKADLIGDDTAVEGAARLLWVKGQSVPGLRDRDNLLGDIVNSSPVFAGRKKYNFQLLSDSLGGLTYDTYYETYKKNRREVLYVGANDGMLHAFDATSGAELFSYVPAGIYEKLRKLSSPDYGTGSNPHSYSVDGKLFVGDAYINGSWKNILVGTLGAGGKGFFVLDITSPDLFNESKVLMDLTDPDLYTTTFSGLGNITSEPVVAPTKNGWKIFLGNGYNSTAGNAALFAVDLNVPAANTKVIVAGTAGANGLAGPALLANGDGEVVSAYAGDLLGNMWKFDLDDAQTSKWGIAYQNGNGGNAVDAPLFTALDPSDNIQKITSTPTLGLNAKMDNAVMVYFGTGSYLTNSDNNAGSVINSVYAIADQGAPVTGRDQLFQKTISTQANGLRDVSNNADTSWWTTKKGWYLDLSFGGLVTGERITSKPLLIYDRLLFPTLITSSDPCSFGGSGWMMELVAVGDRYDGHSIFGEDGIEVDYAVISYSEVIRSGEKAYLPTSNIKGELDVTEGRFPMDAVGRMSWRQLR